MMTRSQPKTTISTAKQSEIRISEAELAQLGEDDWGYVRRLSGLEFQTRFSDVDGLDDDTEVFAVFRGNGTPLALTDSAQSAIANMWENDLVPMTLH